MPRDIEIPVDSVRLDLPRSPSPSAVRLAHVERSGPRFTIQLCEHQLSSK
ncbi:hypothetical protein HBI56_206340 [Parastagonospora nodorum]|nr:hypothetical protein HBH53_205150 [Parastagonospora nodorum]KAH3961417.1 hypothetical protein HBH52_231380 [Parastagonospora nodorum]KAH3991948.1 hypothetical protein HBI10_223440 [Parastagonospora nodorum]KAH4009862.1 hypothetical protein HBI13_216000 [Parastagonospora nodorum]KAH4016856.1 hypothetical protein HBI09_201030 [Parastagonospora nodorum]